MILRTACPPSAFICRQRSHGAVDAHFPWPLKFQTRELSLAVCVYLYTRGAARQVRFLATRRESPPDPVYSLLLTHLIPPGIPFIPGTRSTCSRHPSRSRFRAIRLADRNHRKFARPELQSPENRRIRALSILQLQAWSDIILMQTSNRNQRFRIEVCQPL
jgi:hypothetical protein